MPQGSDRKAVTFQLRVPEDWLNRVEAAADRKGLSKAALIRLAVSEWLDGDEAKPRAKKGKQ